MADNEKKIPRTDVNTLGEFGLIDHLTKDFINVNDQTVLGIGDDAAVINYSDKQIVVSTDLLVEGTHFKLNFHYFYYYQKIFGYGSLVYQSI